MIKKGKALLVGSLFNLHGRKLSCMTGCLLVGNPNSRGGAKEIFLKLFLESRRRVLGGGGGDTEAWRGIGKQKSQR